MPDEATALQPAPSRDYGSREYWEGVYEDRGRVGSEGDTSAVCAEGGDGADGGSGSGVVDGGSSGRRDHRIGGAETYEWLQTWAALKEPLGGLVSEGDKILHVGCGDSDLAERMYDDGIRDIVSIDFSERVIEYMQARAGKIRRACAPAGIDTQMDALCAC